MKIAFVAHEFGLYPGHGGIASYLYNICKYILSLNKHEVYVLSITGDKSCDLINDLNFHLISIQNEFDVYNVLQKISPQYVEVADYLALCLYSLKQKASGVCFQDTIFAVHHHTASRECFEWNSLMPIKYANLFIKNCYVKEVQQILLADMQIAPSNFMAKYVAKNYGINEKIYSFNHINVSQNKSKKDILLDEAQDFDYTDYKNSFNIFLISRIEGRKNQEYLIKQFIKFRNSLKINTNLFLVGNTNYDEITGEEFNYKLFKTIPEKERPYIHFYDFMNAEEQKRIIAIGDLCILPSTFESFSIALGETILKGIPGMASKYTGCKDYIERTKDIMCFDPFIADDLSVHMERFYNLSQSDKDNILKQQQENFRQVTNPKISVDKRLDIVHNYKSHLIPLNRNKWKYIYSNESLYPNGEKLEDYNISIALLSNHLNDNTVETFISSNYLNNNFYDKIIILNDSNEYIDNLQDAVNRGLPILILNTQDITWDYQKPYICVLDFILGHQNKLTIFTVPSIKKELNKKYTDYVFIQSNKISLEKKI